MERILVLGATGNLGKVIVSTLLEKHYAVTALVRNPNKLQSNHPSLQIIQGDATSKEDLTQVLKHNDVVISTLGHGFRTAYPIQEKTLSALIPVMEKSHCKRFITVTGAALPCDGDPFSFTAAITAKMMTTVDPYRMSDARKQQELLEKSSLEWTVIRTPVHSNKKESAIIHIGLTQPPPWKTISRKAIAQYIVTCIEDHSWIRQSPIIF